MTDDSAASFLQKYGIRAKPDWLKEAVMFCRHHGYKNERALHNAIFDLFVNSNLSDCYSPLMRIPSNAMKVVVVKPLTFQILSYLDITKSMYSQYRDLTHQSDGLAWFYGDDEHDDVSDVETRRSNTSTKRMLMLTLSDGENEIRAIEYGKKSGLDQLSPTVLPGTKIILTSRTLCRRGILLLNDINCKVLGGSVDTLCEKFERVSFLENRLGINGGAKGKEKRKPISNDLATSRSGVDVDSIDENPPVQNAQAPQQKKANDSVATISPYLIRLNKDSSCSGLNSSTAIANKITTSGIAVKTEQDDALDDSDCMVISPPITNEKSVFKAPSSRPSHSRADNYSTSAQPFGTTTSMDDIVFETPMPGERRSCDQAKESTSTSTSTQQRKSTHLCGPAHDARPPSPEQPTTSASSNFATNQEKAVSGGSLIFREPLRNEIESRRQMDYANHNSSLIVSETTAVRELELCDKRAEKRNPSLSSKLHDEQEPEIFNVSRFQRSLNDSRSHLVDSDITRGSLSAIRASLLTRKPEQRDTQKHNYPVNVKRVFISDSSSADYSENETQEELDEIIKKDAQDVDQSFDMSPGPVPAFIEPTQDLTGLGIEVESPQRSQTYRLWHSNNQDSSQNVFDPIGEHLEDIPIPKVQRRNSSVQVDFFGSPQNKNRVLANSPRKRSALRSPENSSASRQIAVRGRSLESEPAVLFGAPTSKRAIVDTGDSGDFGGFFDKPFDNVRFQAKEDEERIPQQNKKEPYEDDVSGEIRSKFDKLQIGFLEDALKKKRFWLSPQIMKIQGVCVVSRDLKTRHGQWEMPLYVSDASTESVYCEMQSSLLDKLLGFTVQSCQEAVQNKNIGEMSRRKERAKTLALSLTRLDLLLYIEFSPNPEVHPLVVDVKTLNDAFELPI